MTPDAKADRRYGIDLLQFLVREASPWWAGQDSNLQPDRYERPALTIELPARRGGDRLEALSAKACARQSRRRPPPAP